MNPRRASIVCLAFLLGTSSGCGTIIKRVYNEAKGATSKVVTVPGSQTARYADFNAVEITPPRSELGTLIPNTYEREYMKQMKIFLVTDEEAPFKGTEPVLKLDPQIYWYNKGGIKGAFPNQHVVVFFELRAGQELIGKMQVATKSEAARTDDEDMAESLAKGVAKYFRKFKENKAKGLPPPGEDEVIEHGRDDDKEREERQKAREKEAAKRESATSQSTT